MVAVGCGRVKDGRRVEVIDLLLDGLRRDLLFEVVLQRLRSIESGSVVVKECIAVHQL